MTRLNWTIDFIFEGKKQWRNNYERFTLINEAILRINQNRMYSLKIGGRESELQNLFPISDQTMWFSKPASGLNRMGTAQEIIDTKKHTLLRPTATHRE